MSKASHAIRCCLAVAALDCAPAIAAPNVFWTFGFDRHYGHGSGGRAALTKEAVQVAQLSATSSTPTADVLPVTRTPIDPTESRIALLEHDPRI